MTTDVPDLRQAVFDGFSSLGPKVWLDVNDQQFDRRTAVSASEIGQCARRIKYSKIHPVSRTSLGSLGAAERGHDAEQWIVRHLHYHYDANPDWELRYTGDNQRTLIHEGQSGTPDGLLIHLVTNTAFVLDIKSIDPRTNTSRLPRKSNVWQVTQNAYLFREAHAYDVAGSILLYVDSSDYSKLYQYYAPYDDDLARTLKRRARLIMDASTPEALPPEGIYSPASDYTASCSYCPYTELCNDSMNAGTIEAEHVQTKLMEAERAISGIFRRL